MIWSWGGGIRRWRRKRRGEREREEEEEKQQSREVYGGGGGGLVTKSSDSCDPMDCNLPGSSVHGVLQARILEWVAISFSRERYISSVQFSRSVVSDSLRPHESQHTRPLCPSPTPGVHSDSHPSSQWCHPAISSSVVPSPPAPNPSQHQSLFQRVNSLHEVAKVLEFQL